MLGYLVSFVILLFVLLLMGTVYRLWGAVGALRKRVEDAEKDVTRLGLTDTKLMDDLRALQTAQGGLSLAIENVKKQINQAELAVGNEKVTLTNTIFQMTDLLQAFIHDVREEKRIEPPEFGDMVKEYFPHEVSSLAPGTVYIPKEPENDSAGAGGHTESGGDSKGGDTDQDYVQPPFGEDWRV